MLTGIIINCFVTWPLPPWSVLLRFLLMFTIGTVLPRLFEREYSFNAWQILYARLVEWIGPGYYLKVLFVGLCWLSTRSLKYTVNELVIVMDLYKNQSEHISNFPVLEATLLLTSTLL
ncbi:hypothetical protein BDB00DRAFT_854596 [Zychaea mexicana]|uniref:uncharacterized protein n=1 Tax=Zychaea mexicana TaxID=64656 RepID=UPI0022FE589C|nr:uncharacterized protein BDB00DRAFT_854596 [Zychaea mexicana]KAI9484604.1 hypothetical protein BDB00DRAFT_854596 [Zychaea mexicana]